jgi:hypothetical protein
MPAQRPCCNRVTALALALAMAPSLSDGIASGAPPPDADPSLAPWYRSLQQPQSGVSCCSVADCRAVDYRIVDKHYEVFIQGDWLAVPPDKVLTRADNPTGRAVVCWTRSTGIMCFVRGPQT